MIWVPHFLNKSMEAIPGSGGNANREPEISKAFPWFIVFGTIMILVAAFFANYVVYLRGYNDGKFDTEGIYGYPPPAHGMSHMEIEMNNCEMHVKAQQEHNSLSPMCYCQYEEDTQKYFVRCDTCDPFQQFENDECGVPTPGI